MSRRELVAKALKSATPIQLIRVRAVISSSLEFNESPENYTAYRDYNVKYLKRAVRDFDSGRYGSSFVLDSVSDRELADALSDR